MGFVEKHWLCILGFLACLPIQMLFAKNSEQVAAAWAPVFYKDYAHEFTQVDSGFNPVDHPVDLFFDANEDLRDNSINIFRLDQTKVKRALERVPVYYSLIETSTHYYLNYILYHAVDFKVFGHAHDTENVWVIVEKDGSSFGRLVAHVTNVHGYPMIYAPDEARERAWRSKVSYRLVQKILPLIDRHSKEHRAGRAEYVERAASKAFKAFVSSRSHAIYKLSSKAWKEGKGGGAIYAPQSCVECLEKNHAGSFDQVFQYELVSWDKLFQELRNRDLSESAQIFAKDQNLKKRGSGTAMLPMYLAAGIGENAPKANLFFQASFKTPFQLSHPAAMHAWFEGSDKGISYTYLFNPYFIPQRSRLHLSVSAPTPKLD